MADFTRRTAPHIMLGTMARRTACRAQCFDGTILSNDIARMQHTIIETALYADRLIHLRGFSIFAFRSGINEGTAAVILNDELVAEDFRHLALEGDEVTFLDGGNGNGRHRRHFRRRPCQFDRTCTGGGTDSKDGNGRERHGRGFATVFPVWRHRRFRRSFRRGGRFDFFIVFRVGHACYSRKACASNRRLALTSNRRRTIC